MIRKGIPEELAETLLLFAVIFLPAYLAQRGGFDRSLLVSIGYNLEYLIIAIPQVAFLWFLIGRRRRHGEYGLNPMHGRELLSTAALFLLLLAIAVPVVFAGAAATPEGTEVPGAARLNRLSPVVIAVVACSAVATGYREELYFRSLLFTDLTRFTGSPWSAGAASSLLFAAGHLYQGLPAFAGAAIMGGALAWWFHRKRNVHVVALAHGLYNFAILSILTLSGV